MAQVTTGVRRILSMPAVYSAFQSLIGGANNRQKVVDRYVRPQPGMVMLDIGCGPAQVLEHLPAGVRYVGFDASESYISEARERYGDRGEFYQQYVSLETLSNPGSYDIVTAFGLLHHLDDQEVRDFSTLAISALKPGGRLLTLDPTYVEGQNPIARFVISRDRGQNIRTPSEYQRLLATDAFQQLECSVAKDLLRIPYTHAIVSGTKQ